MRRVNFFLHGIDTTNEWVGRILMPFPLILVVLVVVEVIQRHVFNNPTQWSWEVQQHIFVLAISLAAGYVLLHNQHVGCDIVYARYSNRVKGIASIIGGLLALLYLGAMVWKGFGWSLISLTSGEHSASVWAPPIYYLKIAVFVGCVLFLLQGVAWFIRSWITTITAKGDK